MISVNQIKFMERNLNVLPAKKKNVLSTQIKHDDSKLKSYQNLTCLKKIAETEPDLLRNHLISHPHKAQELSKLMILFGMIDSFDSFVFKPATQLTMHHTKPFPSIAEIVMMSDEDLLKYPEQSKNIMLQMKKLFLNQKL